MSPTKKPIHETLDWPKVKGLTEQQVVTLGRCGTPQQFWSMATTFLAGTCPFCQREHFDGDVAKEFKYWFVFQPYGTYNRHSGSLMTRWVVAYRTRTGARHPSRLSEIPEKAWAEMEEVVNFLDPNQTDPGGALYVRFGDPRYNGCTVPNHLHWVYDVPNGLEKVRPAIYKDEAGWKKDLERFKAYWRVFEQSKTIDEFIEKWEAG